MAMSSKCFGFYCSIKMVLPIWVMGYAGYGLGYELYKLPEDEKTGATVVLAVVIVMGILQLLTLPCIFFLAWLDDSRENSSLAETGNIRSIAFCSLILIPLTIYLGCLVASWTYFNSFGDNMRLSIIMGILASVADIFMVLVVVVERASTEEDDSDDEEASGESRRLIN